MSLIAIDLGGTKIAAGVFSSEAELLHINNIQLNSATGKLVGKLLTDQVSALIKSSDVKVTGIGVSVPGISNQRTGTVWAPNIQGWENYPLLQEIKSVAPDIPISIESDRSCYILGEMWKGNAVGCSNAIFIAVGTGIGAGIVADGNIIHGSADIAGAIGWMALHHPYREEYVQCGCFEYNASGNGIARLAKKLLYEDEMYNGALKKVKAEELTSHDIFTAYDHDDPLAVKVIRNAIQYWGMAIANLVSIFNPEKIIMGGGVFGPAIQFIPDIYEEAKKWAQPISITQVTIVPSKLGNNAGLYGAGYLALRMPLTKSTPDV
jgi:glucokinase